MNCLCHISVIIRAERRGFEPLKHFRRLHAFQACLLNHSSIFPKYSKRQRFGLPKIVRNLLFFLQITTTKDDNSETKNIKMLIFRK